MPQSMVVDANLADANARLAGAITAAGGVVTEQQPGLPLRFTIKDASKRFIFGYRYFTYQGTATALPVDAAHTRIEIAVRPPQSFLVYLGINCVGVLLIYFLFLETLQAVPGGAAIFWIAFLAAYGYGTYKGMVQFPAELATRVVSGLATPGAASAVVSAAPAATVPARPAGNAFDQLKQLAELHASGVLNDEEFKAKKDKLLAEI